MADARVVRTRARLTDAVLELARAVPVEDLTIEEVCERSGVSRATFYRHAASPVDLAVRHLRAELDERRSSFVVAIAPDLPAEQLAAVQTASIRGLAVHLERYREVYARSLGRGRSALRHLLGDHLRAASLEYLLVVQARIPELAGSSRVARPMRMRAYADNLAGGQLGVMWAWAREGEGKPEDFVALVVELLPAWNRRLLGLAS